MKNFSLAIHMIKKPPFTNVVMSQYPESTVGFINQAQIMLKDEFGDWKFEPLTKREVSTELQSL